MINKTENRSPRHFLHGNPSPCRGRSRRRTVALLAQLLPVFLLAGCTPTVDTMYGQRSGVLGGKSVNGTAVLAEMFEQAGHRVSTWHWLSPKLDKADVIVWAPDDYEPPSKEVVDWLNTWQKGDSHGDDEPLDHEGPRTLIYIGRDFDAGPLYWQKVGPGAPASQRGLISAQLAEETARVSSERAALPKKAETDWFTIDSSAQPRKVRRLSGPWSQGIDASKVEIELASKLVPQDPKGDEMPVEVLLATKKDPIVSARHWGDDDGSESGSLILVQNGSFLLNLPLVNHEHRKLAGRLIDSVGSPEKKIVFLESGSGGPPILPEDPKPTMPSGFKLFTVWPFNYVLLQLAVLGTIFCFARWPIFGLGRNLPDPDLADFGRHVAAVGELLAKTKDHDYAQMRLEHYRQSLRSEGGKVQS